MLPSSNARITDFQSVGCGFESRWEYQTMAASSTVLRVRLISGDTVFDSPAANQGFLCQWQTSGPLTRRSGFDPRRTHQMKGSESSGRQHPS